MVSQFFFHSFFQFFFSGSRAKSISVSRKVSLSGLLALSRSRLALPRLVAERASLLVPSSSQNSHESNGRAPPCAELGAVADEDCRAVEASCAQCEAGHQSGPRLTDRRCQSQSSQEARVSAAADCQDDAAIFISQPHKLCA